jgi:hypothetical protein
VGLLVKKVLLIDAALHKKLAARAREIGRTPGQIAEQALRDALKAGAAPTAKSKPRDSATVTAGECYEAHRPVRGKRRVVQIHSVVSDKMRGRVVYLDSPARSRGSREAIEETAFLSFFRRVEPTAPALRSVPTSAESARPRGLRVAVAERADNPVVTGRDGYARF